MEQQGFDQEAFDQVMDKILAYRPKKRELDDYSGGLPETDPDEDEDEEALDVLEARDEGE